MKKLFIQIVLVLIIVLNLPLFRVLSVSNRKNPSEKIYSRNGLNGFIISYTHSVNKGRVHDWYTTKNGKIILLKTVVVSYGAGIPEPEEIENCIFTAAKDGYELTINKSMDNFLLAVGVIAEHSITVGDHEFFLKDFFKPQTSLNFQVKRVSLINYIYTQLRSNRRVRHNN